MSNPLNKFLSILVSLLFPITAVAGMMFGQLASRLFSSLFSPSIGYGQIGGEFIFFTISGYCAGYFSAFIISKVYKKFHFEFTLIIPILMMLYFGYDNIVVSSSVSFSYLINSLARDLVMLITFYLMLTNYSLNNER